ncbi:DUF2490 domain-containing protein [Sandarakinorhabdus sp. AAP62]|uniref:DUF2490 domain-containing protein n=1 Tax=Sandarakinorhabdus sp. AAP62 TaxID=1248916 RepID=UPI000475E77A|nr:DUF2490 domain-containing protein [Sandarakinorhabdus sp. AAP62]
MRYISVISMLLASPAAAQDVQSWNTLLVQGPVDGKLLLWAEVQPRFTNDADRLGQFIARGALGVRLKNDIDLHAGYHFQHNNPAPGITSDEHRFWQQVMAPVLRQENGFALITRWRLEQRTFEGADDLGWRLRMQWRVQQPLHGKGSAGPLAWSETFFALNSTDWGARGGFDQQRSFIGWLQPLGKRLNLEAGYMHQHINRPGRNPGNHVINLTLNRRLG